MDDGLDLGDLPLVGQEAVVERLHLGLRTAAAGKGRTVVLRGERGTGKSRLARTLRTEAERQGFSVACGAAFRAEAGVPYALISDAFLPLVRSQPSHALEVLTRGGIHELEYLFPGLLPPGAGGPFRSFHSAQQMIRVPVKSATTTAPPPITCTVRLRGSTMRLMVTNDAVPVSGVMSMGSHCSPPATR